MEAAAFEWTGALLGLLGALLLATNTSISRYGWVAFLGANIAMTAFAATIGAHGLLLQHLGSTATTLLGLRRSGLLALRRDVHAPIKPGIWGTAPIATAEPKPGAAVVCRPPLSKLPSTKGQAE